MADASGGQTSLAGAKGLKCAFPVYATGTWQNGEARGEVKTATLTLSFTSIDTDDGTAQSVDRFGPAEITVRLVGGSLHFMQIGTSSALYVTTVFSKETRAGKRQAVHTRHEYTEISLPGFTSRPEQYYGECDVVP